MCDFKRITLQNIFKMGVQTLEVFLVWWRKLLKRIETYKNDKNTNFTLRSMIDLMFLNWHNCINNEDIWLKFYI